RPLFFARLRHIGSPMVPTPMNPIMSVMSVHDEKFGAVLGARTMRHVAVGHLVALAGLQHHGAPVSQLGVQFTFHHQQDMALLAPGVGKVARRVFDHAHADVVEGAGAPEGLAGLAGMLRALHVGPVGRAERYVEHQHGGAFSTVCACRYAASRSSCASLGSDTQRAASLPPTQSAATASARSRARGAGKSVSTICSMRSSTSW